MSDSWLARRAPGFPCLYYILEFAQIHVHWVGDAMQPSHPLSPTPNLDDLDNEICVFVMMRIRWDSELKKLM